MHLLRLSRHQLASPATAAGSASPDGRVVLLGWIAVITTVAAVGLAARLSLMTQVASVVAAGCFVLLSLRYPLLPLFAFAALIPLDEALFVEGFGPLGRFAGLAFAVAYAVPRLGRLRLGAMPVPGWLFAGWVLLSLVWALEPGVTMRQLPTFVQLFAITVLIADAVSRQPTLVRPLLLTYSVAAGLTGALAIASYVGGGVTVQDRVSAFADQDVAQFAAILLPALVFALHELVDRRWVLLNGAIAAITLVAILLSGTRGAWVSIIVVLGLLVLPRLHGPARLRMIGLTALGIALALQLPGVGEAVVQRSETALSSGGAGRTDLWSVGVSIWADEPLTGVGYGNFPEAFTGERIRETDVEAGLSPGRGPHNLVLGTLGELGIVGLAALAAFILPLSRAASTSSAALTLQAGLASLLIAGMFLDLDRRKELWLLLGLAAGLHAAAKRSRSRPEAEKEEPRLTPIVLARRRRRSESFG